MQTTKNTSWSPDKEGQGTPHHLLTGHGRNSVRVRFGCWALGGCVVLAVVLGAQPAFAAEFDGNNDGDGGDGVSWSDPWNWDTDSVANGEAATIGLGFTGVTLSNPVPDPSQVTVGPQLQTGGLTIDGQDLNIDRLMVGMSGGEGSLTLRNGANVLVGTGIDVGKGLNFGGSLGSLTINGSATSLAAPVGTFGGRGGDATVTLNAGTLTLNAANRETSFGLSDHSTVGDGNASGTLIVNGGTADIQTGLALGKPNRAQSAAEWGDAFGQVTQSAGQVNVGANQSGHNVPKALMLGAEASFGNPKAGTATGLYQLHGGTLTVHGGVKLGMHENNADNLAGAPGCGGSGSFELGNADGTGTFEQAGGPAGAPRDIEVRANPNSDGTFIGHGSADFTGTLINNGRVIADGYGADRSLDMSAFSSVDRTVEDENLTSPTGAASGWYARNGGRLLLPAVPVSGGNSSVRWGENGTATQLGMVNSVEIDFTMMLGGGLNIALLADDRTDVQPPPTGVAFVGVWDITGEGGLSFGGVGSADLTIRYDASAAADAGLSEADLKFYHYTGGSWTDITTSLDTGNDLISGDGVTSFSQFAVGAIPEPASAGLLVLGGLTLIRRGRRRSRA